MTVTCGPPPTAVAAGETVEWRVKGKVITSSIGRFRVYKDTEQKLDVREVITGDAGK